jgi:hypothetical protein
LDNAPFDIKDETLIKKCASCLLCTKRTGANKLLFDDIQKNDNCLDRKCFEKKAEAHLDKAYLLAVEEGLPIIAGWAYGDEKQQLKDRFPGVIFTDDYNMSDKKKGVKALSVDGNDAGTFQYIKIIKSKENSNGKAIEPTIKEQIEKLEGRIIRNRELDEEKIYNAAIEKAKTFKFAPIDSFNPDTIFGKIFTLFLYDIGRGDTTESINSIYTGKKKKVFWMDRGDRDKIIDQILDKPEKLKDDVFNIFIQDLISRYGSPKNVTQQGIRIMNLLFNLYSAELGYTEISKPFMDKAAFREDRHNKALALLKGQLKTKPKVKKK